MQTITGKSIAPTPKKIVSSCYAKGLCTFLFQLVGQSSMDQGVEVCQVQTLLHYFPQEKHVPGPLEFQVDASN